MIKKKKLKSENKILRGIIEELVFNPDSDKSKQIVFNLKLTRDVENAMMAGSPTTKPNVTHEHK